MIPLDQRDVLAWAIGKTWWIGPIVVVAVLLLLGALNVR